jgi:hypothetical protein
MITIADAWISRAGQTTSSEVEDGAAASASLVIDRAPGDSIEESVAGDREIDPSLSGLNPFRPIFRCSLKITYRGFTPNEYN